MKNLGYELITAEYTNSEYNTVRAIWQDPENTEAADGSELLVETIIEVDDNSISGKSYLN